METLKVGLSERRPWVHKKGGMLQFKYEMFLTFSCVSTLGLWMLTLSGLVLESMKQGTLLEEVSHGGWAKDYTLVLFLA